ncbi:potassium channel-like protein [Cucurbitaria berberidis CBS 394.84]|uniref:Potassium channel-like protein n=1 Tax=Cucurbitaria berberidis CBS 394.84 TaxID=1168544 RepID=A0A9P4G9J4_9PLEO|nr:potassium channel-like protein [Cucurbitaria berberidis CBS 394.84]KAF1841469.1 potassium channel-like protein [Cucurbitaria berberidis CBS 394.84]
MNDPGLHEPANEAAQDAEDKVQNDDKKEDKQAEDEEDEYLDPSRWWFASTASPLLAGTFGPMANAFSICALVEKWRVYIPPGSDEAHGIKIEDPKWLIAVNSISLVLALVANIALLLNMSRRLSFAIAQPITIIGFYLASFLLIALVAVASTSVFRIQPLQEHALGQAYYYGIMAAGVYFIISSLMVFTALGAYQGHYPKEFRLTPSQRTLMLQTIGFMVYLLLGALVFSTVENWNFLDGVFWADFTLLTVGLGGEFVPKSHTGRGLLFPYAIGGLVMIGLVIGSIRSLILEHGKQKMAARFVENKREKVLSSIDDESRTIRLGPFETIKFSQKGLSESQRREQEFRVMRRVQELSQRKRRWIALAISTAAALLLWFLGALVFMFSEKPQGFSYFVSLYFAYTTLLTIGYGDFTVNSNAGKAFFVFWSMLAVPTLTILISNMGDTVIKEFKDFTIWIGSLTVLPDEAGLGTSLKVGIKRMTHGKMHEEEEDYRKATSGASEQRNLDRLAGHIEEAELGEAEEAGEHGDYLERDIHFYHFVLAKEIRKLMKDVDASPARQYKYQEWQFYLRLIGQDENDASGHRKPATKQQKNGSDSPDIGTADDGDTVAWSWLGIRSPLMGNQSEAQWLLERLGATLEAEMRKMSSPDAKKRKEPPPISMAELKRKGKNQSSKEGNMLQKEVGSSEARRRGHNAV